LSKIINTSKKCLLFVSCNHTGNANQEQISEEYLTDNDHIDQYEQECLTDDNAYSEYFRDDYNEADRFTL
jgi:hypothetical protein